MVGEDLTTCVKKFRICNNEVRCSNQDQIDCPLCAKNFIYCDLYATEIKCVELKRLCLDSDQLIGCSANRTNIENECERFKLSQSNHPTTTEATTTSQDSETTADSTDPSTKQSPTSKSPPTQSTTLTPGDDLTSSTTTESSSISTATTTTEIYNSITASSTDPSTALSSTTEFSEFSSPKGPTRSTEHAPTSPSSTTEKSTFHAPHNIMDFSRLFKSDYGGFNFSDFIYKGNSKGGQLKPDSFYSKYTKGGGTGFDYSKFMGGQKKDDKTSDGQKQGASGFDFSKYMSPYMGNGGGGFDFSKYMSGFDYSKYMGQGGGQSGSQGGLQGSQGGQQGDFAKYMSSGQTNADGKPQAWGADKFNYSAYQKSGLNNKNSKGAGMYANDIKSGQKNQDKYAKGYFDYAKSGGGNQTGYDSYYSGYVSDQSNQTNYQDYSKYTNNQKQTNYQDFSKYTGQSGPKSAKMMAGNPTKGAGQQAAGGSDYSKYMKQYASGDYSKYYSKYMSGYQGGGQPNMKGAKSDDLIRMTGSRQPTKSFSSWYDYSKYLKPGGNQMPDESAHSSKKKQLKASDLPAATNLRMSQAPETKATVHKAPYIANFKSDIIRMQEDNQKRIRMQTDKELGETPNEAVKVMDMNPLNGVAQSPVQQPVRYGQQLSDPNLEREEGQSAGAPPGYHHIEMQNQAPQYQPTKIGKEPNVNVSKILPNMMTNKYNYTHYGSGVFFINFGTIVNGRNNVVGSANDIGNGNGELFIFFVRRKTTFGVRLTGAYYKIIIR